MKIGNRLPIATPYGRFFENFRNSNFFSQKVSFRELGLRKITATRRQTLVHHLGQTIGPTTIKFGMHLSEGTLYGHFFENL